eukprot:s2342_g4.t1
MEVQAAQNPTPIKATMFDTCFALSKQYFVPIDEVKKCLEEFKQIDTSGDMLISEAEFEASTRQNLNWPEDQDLPANLARKIKKYFQDMDKDRNDVIDFEEYFDWSMKHRWSEEFLALDDKDMENRNFRHRLRHLQLCDLELLSPVNFMHEIQVMYLVTSGHSSATDLS